MMLSSFRNLALMTGRTRLLHSAPRWQLIIGFTVVLPSLLATLILGVLGEGKRSHFHTAHGVGAHSLYHFPNNTNLVSDTWFTTCYIHFASHGALQTSQRLSPTLHRAQHQLNTRHHPNRRHHTHRFHRSIHHILLHLPMGAPSCLRRYRTLLLYSPPQRCHHGPRSLSPPSLNRSPRYASS